MGGHISIHALLAESDPQLFLVYRCFRISIHALLAESDDNGDGYAQAGQRFLSTLSLRRATGWQFAGSGRTEHFYPRSPCGERLMGTAPSATELIFLSTLSLRRATGRLAGYDAGNQNFYPRSPCGERQLERRYLRLCSDYFYPRSPCGERPFGITAPHRQTAISIHALLAESDIYLILVSSRFKYFYPRSPCGERLYN